jgi:hypothetical protein
MVAKIGQSRAQNVSLPKETKAPAKSAQAASSGSAQKAWGPKGAGAAKKPQTAGALKIAKAEIGDGPKTTEKLTLPRGYSQVDSKFTLNDSFKLTDGRDAKLEVNYDRLSIKGPDGKSFEISPPATKDLEETKKWFHEEFEGKSKEDLEMAGFPEWSDERSFMGAGGAGKMVSIMESVNSYEGGAHPNHGTGLMTLDVRSGKQMKLDDLLPRATVDKLAEAIYARLQTTKTSDGEVEGSAFNMSGDVKSIRDTINTAFALQTDKSGKVNIEIAWESGIHAMGGLMAHFTVPAPTDDAFKAKIGME